MTTPIIWCGENRTKWPFGVAKTEHLKMALSLTESKREGTSE